MTARSRPLAKPATVSNRVDDEESGCSRLSLKRITRATKGLLFFAILMIEKTDVAVASFERAAGSCLRMQPWSTLEVYSSVRIQDIGFVLDFVNGMVLLMKKTVQPLLNGNVHGRRRHLRIYFIEGNVMDVVEVRKVE